MTGRLVAGVDCSTQSTKVLVCDAETGEVVANRAGEPPGHDRGRPRGLVAGADVGD